MDSLKRLFPETPVSEEVLHVSIIVGPNCTYKSKKVAQAAATERFFSRAENER